MIMSCQYLLLHRYHIGRFPHGETKATAHRYLVLRYQTWSRRWGAVPARGSRGRRRVPPRRRREVSSAGDLITLERLVIVILSTWKQCHWTASVRGPFALWAGLSDVERGYTTNMRSICRATQRFIFFKCSIRARLPRPLPAPSGSASTTTSTSRTARSTGAPSPYLSALHGKARSRLQRFRRCCRRYPVQTSSPYSRRALTAHVVIELCNSTPRALVGWPISSRQCAAAVTPTAIRGTSPTLD